jgi:hypothetical protein
MLQREERVEVTSVETVEGPAGELQRLVRLPAFRVAQPA